MASLSEQPAGAPASVPPDTGRAAVFSPLLFRQVCLLAAMTGMLAFRYPAHGLLACILLALFMLPDASGTRRSGERDFRKPVLFLCAFCLGFVFSAMNAPATPGRVDYPQWVREAAVPVDERPKPFTRGVALTGTIRETTPLAGNRLRIILEDVRADGEDAPLPGNLVVTWESPPPALAAAGPGQRLSATLRIREIRGFANPGTWETETYWRDRNAYFRAWSKDDGTRDGKNAPYRLGGEASPAWKARAALRDAVLEALAVETPESRADDQRAAPSPAGNDAADRRERTARTEPPETTAADSVRSPDVPQSAATIPALLFGDRSLFDAGTLDRVARATLAHSLALSGMHLGFAAAIGYGAASVLQFLFPALFLRLPRQKAGLLLAVPLCLVYLWIGGAPPSLVRAALMLLFWGILLWLNRPKVLLDGLIWAVALILLATPAALFDIRLQLSAVSVAGIALVSPLLTRLAKTPHAETRTLRKAAGRLLRVVAGMALISVAAQAAVLPIVLDAFPGTGLWFPLNLLWLPVLGMWVMPLAFAGLFCAALGLTLPASGLFFLAQVPCAGLFSLLESMDAAGVLLAPVSLRPAFTAAAGYWTILLLVPCLLARRALSRKTAVLLGTALVLGIAPSLQAALAERQEAVRLRLIDVGQGQSLVVSWTTGGQRGRMLVDGGGFASPFFDVGKQIVTPVLTDNAPPRLNWIVNTHPDTDHLRGLLFPLETFSVGRAVFGPQGLTLKRTAAVGRCEAALARRNIPVALRKAGDTLVLGPDLVMEVLHPGADDSALSSNNASLVLRLVWRGKPLVLLCGDVERKGIRRLLERGLPLRAQVLVVPHHGAANALSATLYDAVEPELALVSCGYATSTVRPAVKVKEALRKRGIPIAATADRGQIDVVWDSQGGMAVRTAREQ